MNENNSKVLVMGINGMLGSMVYRYFRDKKAPVAGTWYGSNPFPADDHLLFPFDASAHVSVQVREIIRQFHADYIINCIGIIKPWCRDDDPAGVKNAIVVNALFPHLLADACAELNPGTRIITIATDCVYSGSKGNYTENDPHDPLDVYGKTKSLGEVRKSNFLNIRTSIIGPELTGKKSLLEWFLSNPDGSTVQGFTHHHWNGVTTLQFAQLCDRVMMEGTFDKHRKINHLLHWVENESVNKYELLRIFNEVFERKINIVPVGDVGEPVDRTLDSVLLPAVRKPMNDALLALKEFLK
jgi:dTDP-4-dehydrorhamnose reductase